MPATISRRLSPTDNFVCRMDRLLKSASGPHLASRPYPAAALPETVTDPLAKRTIAALMRVNHAGEICAQALYHGQAVAARRPAVREALHEAAQEEVDHLAWCAQRLDELEAHPSVLDPLWYLGSFVIGAVAGISGDQRSLGFVAETERQVVAHLGAHIYQLPHNDQRSRAILQQMMSDEARHGSAALNYGGQLPSAPLQQLMKFTAKIMTTLSSRM